MIYWARAKYVRISPYKVNRVLKLIRGKTVEEAFNILTILRVKPKIQISKVLKSALSNAGMLNHPEKMKIKYAYVGKGPYLKRIRPRAFGRADIYTRKMCHINIGIEEV
ncbi:MAG: 50S ribosomal protein L22 [Caldiserica bacterium]|nr:MAG: 50S ribosomal protein L22 [Caldisericota bacterium]